MRPNSLAVRLVVTYPARSASLELREALDQVQGPQDGTLRSLLLNFWPRCLCFQTCPANLLSTVANEVFACPSTQLLFCQSVSCCEKGISLEQLTYMQHTWV